MSLKELAKQIVSISFNQDTTFFACVIKKGFRVFKCDQYAKHVERNFDKYRFGKVQLLYRSELMFFVGNGTKQFSKKQVFIWDDQKSKIIAELCFTSPVESLHVREDILLVVNQQQTQIINLKDLEPIKDYETYQNSKGIASVCGDPREKVFAILGKKKNCVRIIKYNMRNQPIFENEIENVHNHPLHVIQLNYNGSLLATTSDEGTRIRIFDVISKKKLFELRRGSSPAKIFNIAFNFNSTLVAVTSSSSTMHVFQITTDNGQNTKKNSKKKKKKRSLFSSMVSPDAIESFARGRDLSKKYTICGFNKEGYLFVVTVDGTFYKFYVDLEKRKLVNKVFTEYLRHNQNFDEEI
ncbi:wd-repeat protein interacting with phosphoinosides wipi -related [Anaeramoeba flamelloides]|uniref:Wd-repeat protein interacting with phosphoinosides wipi -related n=1 Tax=Anaeramoeba flamelloides TaxID=1746091 RepID=A0AAV7ZI78_9EUKA|nr:wd-repeat protein interacting with phosphoinosides wipi -related [Anaeramoeba flamelloides]KAJ6237885.1 wd-repeat protein interacting with phosphoinosides wipi -related [Anaeramoeba flamelloides]